MKSSGAYLAVLGAMLGLFGALTAAVLEKGLGTRGTARNWNTVLKLGEMVGLKA